MRDSHGTIVYLPRCLRTDFYGINVGKHISYMDPLEIFGRSVRNLTHQVDTQKSSNTQLLINVELLCNPYKKSTKWTTNKEQSQYKKSIKTSKCMKTIVEEFAAKNE